MVVFPVPDCPLSSRLTGKAALGHARNAPERSCPGPTTSPHVLGPVLLREWTVELELNQPSPKPHYRFGVGQPDPTPVSRIRYL